MKRFQKTAFALFADWSSQYIKKVSDSKSTLSSETGIFGTKSHNK